MVAARMIAPIVASITKRISLAGVGEVVLVDAKGLGSFDPARNILLLNDKSEVIWQIEPATQTHGVVGFLNLYLGKSNELLAYGSNGIEYAVDAKSGKILGKELIR